MKNNIPAASFKFKTIIQFRIFALIISFIIFKYLFILSILFQYTINNTLHTIWKKY